MFHFKSIILIFIILTFLLINIAFTKDYNSKTSETKIHIDTAILSFGQDYSDQEDINILTALTSSDSTSDSDENIERNKAILELRQNYPNPFNLSTTIEYSIPDESEVFIAIYNIFGKRVKTIQDEVVSPGKYKVSWNGRDDTGDSLASGVYFYLLSSNENFIIHKMILLK